jgi:hypothetical protein
MGKGSEQFSPSPYGKKIILLRKPADDQEALMRFPDNQLVTDIGIILGTFP